CPGPTCSPPGARWWPPSPSRESPPPRAFIPPAFTMGETPIPPLRADPPEHFPRVAVLVVGSGARPARASTVGAGRGAGVGERGGDRSPVRRPSGRPRRERLQRARRHLPAPRLRPGLPDAGPPRGGRGPGAGGVRPGLQGDRPVPRRVQALHLDLPDRREPLQKPHEVPVAPPRWPPGGRGR